MSASDLPPVAVPLLAYSMTFDGRVLARGFWLYAGRIRGPATDYVYVGRTGDSSSPNASSPFNRIGQHLEAKPSAKGNALAKQLRKAEVEPEACSFEMVAIGPVFPEQADLAAHIPVRDRMAALERSVADNLRHRGYAVLGAHPRAGSPDQHLLEQVVALLESKFPVIAPDSRDVRETGTRMMCNAKGST